MFVMHMLEEKNLIRGLMFHLTCQICIPKTLMSTASSSSASTIQSGAEDHGVQGGFLNRDNFRVVERAAKSRQLSWVADKAWAGPGVTMADPCTCRRQSLGSTGDRGGQTGHGMAVCLEGCTGRSASSKRAVFSWEPDRGSLLWKRNGFHPLQLQICDWNTGGSDKISLCRHLHADWPPKSWECYPNPKLHGAPGPGSPPRVQRQRWMSWVQVFLAGGTLQGSGHVTRGP